eukprot:scaffold115204_cov33-Tisochrysis_lutea.AAC.3
MQLLAEVERPKSPARGVAPTGTVHPAGGAKGNGAAPRGKKAGALAAAASVSSQYPTGAPRITSTLEELHLFLAPRFQRGDQETYRGG